MKEKMDNEQSLALITEMIQQAKKNVSKGGSFQLLLWGWVVSLANFGHYGLERSGYEYPYIVWLLAVPAVVISIIHNIRLGRRSEVVTYLDRLHGHIWIAVSVGIFLILVFMNVVNFNHNPIILFLAGIGTYLSGTVLRFRPVIFGGIILWIGSAIGFILPVIDQYLVGGIFIIFGYLIPGYLLKNAERG